MRFLFCVAALCLFAVSCGGSDDSVALEPSTAAGAESVDPTPTQTPAQPTTVAPTSVPAPTAVALLTADEQIAAAIAAYDANPVPAEVQAWEHVDAEFLENRVRLQVCVWDGESIYETLHVAEYGVENTATGAQANLNFDNTLTGTCRSQQLIDSLFSALRDFDNFWAPVLADPTTFDPIEAAKYNTAHLVTVSTDQVDDWTADGLSWREAQYNGQLPDTVVADILWRRFQNQQGTEILEVVACREMASDFGLYRGDVLVDDFKPTEAGPHAIVVYTVERNNDKWLVDNADSGSHSDCLGDRWLEVINEWKPDPVTWEVLDDA